MSRPRVVPESVDLGVPSIADVHVHAFEEQIVARGLTQEGKAMFELFTSEGGSWTLIVTDTEGKSCIIASGEGWHDMPRIKGDPA